VQLLADRAQELGRLRRGLMISAISTFCGARASSERTIVVLPVPTSPVSWMKPPPR